MTPRQYRAQCWAAIFITALTLALVAAAGIWGTADFDWSFLP